jgi:hypothetical protein
MTFRTALSNRAGLFPLGILLLLFVVGNAVAYFLESRLSFLIGTFGIFQLFAYFLAQAGFYCVLGGILGRAWISSFLIGTVCAVLATLAFGYYIDQTEVQIFIFGVVPLLLFCGCLPFLLLRSWRGWHLHRTAKPFVEPYSLRMGDIFLATTVVAGLVASTMASVSFAVDESDAAEGLVQLLMFFVVAVVGSSVAVVPVTISYFRASTRRQRGLVLLGFGMLGLMAVIGTTTAIGLWAEFDVLTALGYALPPAATAIVLFSMELVVLRASGYRWVVVKPNTQPEPTVDIFSQSAQPTARCLYRRRNLIATAGIVACSIVLSITISALQQGRLALAKTYAELNGKLAVNGGYLEHVGHQPIALKVVNLQTDQPLPVPSMLQGLQRISLSGQPVNKSSLETISKLKSLTEIDLSYSTFDDSSVKLLELNGRVAKLSLAGSRVTAKGLGSLVGHGRYYKIDIGYLDINDEALAQLSVSKLHELVLKGNPITDKSLQHVASIWRLNLSETKCTGTGLGQLTGTLSLVLDGTSADDSAIKQLLASNKALCHLSLRNTQVTDALLPTLQQTPSLTELEIGEGKITRDGLLAVAFAPPERLALNSKKFDATLFAEWHPSIRRLDMSESGVSDQDVANLKNVRGLTELSLARCNVSDACLPKLVTLGVTKIDLTGTQVTAAAVAKLFPKTTVVYLSAEQCQPEQLSTPDPDGRLRIGARMNIDSQNY